MDIFTLGIGFIAGIGFMIIIDPIKDSRIASKLKPKLNDESGLPDNICGHMNIGCTKYRCNDE